MSNPNELVVCGPRALFYFGVPFLISICTAFAWTAWMAPLWTYKIVMGTVSVGVIICALVGTYFRGRGFVLDNKTRQLSFIIPFKGVVPYTKIGLVQRFSTHDFLNGVSLRVHGEQGDIMLGLYQHPFGGYAKEQLDKLNVFMGFDSEELSQNET